ncbi:hypothetical protein H2199_000689 [Coniosporium tulheliwenetii]|uniref:Uncharacterized protein n=1 Tax=Coniosporium tulheliwenetii TaxID=3383036 RepID=A0ACC2ZMF6_9PEZI|nr:hypothetical protein H2199_000689 [Cladosporium sp. JES 115]
MTATYTCLQQILYANMLDVVAGFRNTSRYDFYVNAARTFRMPYWDWAAAPPEGQNSFPSSLTIRDVQVTLPNGTAVIPNPLYAYRFHPVPSDFSPYIPQIPWIMNNMTLRQPQPPRSRQPADGNDIVVQRMNFDRLMLRDRLYNVLTTYDNFTDAGTEAWKADNALKWDSLEAVHNIPHNNIGGHMWYLPWSAFDPVFWLHHTMVDRTLAMWQALYPDSYVEPMRQTQPSWSYPVGTVLDASSPLTPFHSDSSGGFWTSETSRSTLTFGYTYPELGTGNDTAALRRVINELYGPSTAMSPQKRDSLSKRHRADGCEELTADGGSGSCPSQYGHRKNPSYQPAPVTREYLVNIKAQRFGLGSSTVYVFVGNPGADSASWWSDNTLAGTYAMFAMPNPTCQDCMRMQAAGTVPLNTVLEAKVAAGELGGLEESIVVPYLQKNLQWRITKVDGTEVPAAQVPDFKIAVVSTEVMPPTAMSDFPTWSSEYTVHGEITGGRPGGFTAGDVI